MEKGLGKAKRSRYEKLSINEKAGVVKCTAEYSLYRGDVYLLNMQEYPCAMSG